MIGDRGAVDGSRDNHRTRVPRQFGEGGDAVGEVAVTREAVAEPEDATSIGLGDVPRD